MQGYSQEDPLDDLLNEKLSDSELREVLEQLGHLDFGGGEESRIRDVVEGTGADPKLIGQILSSIRQESFDEKYGHRIEAHEKRLEALERERLYGANVMTQPVSESYERNIPYPPPPFVQKLLDDPDPAWKHLTTKDFNRGKVVAVVTLIIVFLMILILGAAGVFQN